MTPNLHPYKVLLEFTQNISSYCVYSITQTRYEKYNLLGGDNNLYILGNQTKQNKKKKSIMRSEGWVIQINIVLHDMCSLKV